MSSSSPFFAASRRASPRFFLNESDDESPSNTCPQQVKHDIEAAQPKRDLNAAQRWAQWMALSGEKGRRLSICEIVRLVKMFLCFDKGLRIPEAARPMAVRAVLGRSKFRSVGWPLACTK